MARNNNLAPAGIDKDAIFATIAEYLAEHADFEISVPDEEITRHTAPIAERLEKARAAWVDTVQGIADDCDALRAAVSRLEKQAPAVIEIRREKSPAVRVDNPHKQFSDLLAMIAAGCNVFLSGPAGSGKTTAAEMTAKALGLAFHFTGAVASEFKLTGFVDAAGKYHSTPFRKWCEEGGVFLWDEIDASDARALLSFNAALANRIMEFPDGKIIRLHETCVAIAAANTFGTGADRVYVGRNQLDAASLDRFAFIAWEYDEALELRISGNAEWTRFVQRVRGAVASLKIRAVISPRASIYGARMLAQGMSRDKVESALLFKGMDAATVAKIRGAM